MEPPSKLAGVPWGGATQGVEPDAFDESQPVPASTVTLVEGATFTICGPDGDIDGSGVGGLFVGDTRICSRLVLSIDGDGVEPLTLAARSPSSATFVGRTFDKRLLVFRDLWVGQGIPELFAGLTIDEMPVPVRYPTSCSPRAWASAAPLLVVRALLGLEPDVPRAGSNSTRSCRPGRRR